MRRTSIALNKNDWCPPNRLNLWLNCVHRLFHQMKVAPQARSQREAPCCLSTHRCLHESPPSFIVHSDDGRSRRLKARAVVKPWRGRNQLKLVKFPNLGLMPLLWRGRVDALPLATLLWLIRKSFIEKVFGPETRFAGMLLAVGPFRMSTRCQRNARSHAAFQS